MLDILFRYLLPHSLLSFYQNRRSKFSLDRSICLNLLTQDHHLLFAPVWFSFLKTRSVTSILRSENGSGAISENGSDTCTIRSVTSELQRERVFFFSRLRLSYCFTPYQRLWLYNGAPLVAFYDTLGIQSTYSRLKPPASSRGDVM